MSDAQNSSEFIAAGPKPVEVNQTYRRRIQRYTPYRFGQQSWHRFLADRTAILVRRVGGEPNEHQAGIIAGMISAEWFALKLEAEAEAAETEKQRYGRLRIAADYRRQLLLLDRDLAAATRHAAAAAAADRQKRGPDDVLASIHTRYGARRR